MARPVRMRRLRGFLATVATPLAEGVAGRALPGWLKDMTLRWCEGGLRGRAGGGGDAETAGRTVRGPAADVRRGVSAVPRGEGRSRARSHEAVRGADEAVRGAEGPGMEGARLGGATAAPIGGPVASWPGVPRGTWCLRLRRSDPSVFDARP